MRYRTILVEDEERALRFLKDMLSDYDGDLEVVGEATNGHDAIRLIESMKPDLVFLDVRLPGRDAFQILRELSISPLLVMTTAHAEHALEAFSTNAIGYLLKPYDREDLAAVIRKLKRVSPKEDQIISKLRESLKPREYPQGIVCKVGDKKIVVANKDILYFQAEFKYTSVVTAKVKYLTESSLEYLEDRLDPTIFLRIHRSTIVNFTQIVSLTPIQDGKLAVALNGIPHTVQASKSYSAKLSSQWV